MDHKEIKDKENHKGNHDYWAQRSSTYSDVNKWELEGESRGLWKDVLGRRISESFPGREPGDIRIVDIGAGPGFIPIILTELGYDVTAVDFSPEMIEEAKSNAGDLAEKIDFREMDAQALGFDDESFDLVISRNLTWNLPDPVRAYGEWERVLRPGGVLMNFDANWYRYLFDDEAKDAYAADRAASEELGLGDQNVGENFDVMEDIARSLPLSKLSRPEWDIEVLTGLGMDASFDKKIWKLVWTQQEQTNFASTPMFLVIGRKRK